MSKTVGLVFDKTIDKLPEKEKLMEGSKVSGSSKVASSDKKLDNKDEK